jgi:small subunit ribosomal protein S5
MTEETKQEATTPEVATATVAPEAAEAASTDAPAVVEAQEGATSPYPRRNASRDARGGANDKRNPRRPRRGGRRDERVRQEYEQKIISIRRVVRVMGGGRRFSFSVAMVIGDKKGKVGVGIGKAGDTQLAIEKAMRDAKKNLFTVPMNKDQHIPHDVHTKYASSEVMIMPAPGRGLVAGSSVRTVLELAGVKDVTAKIFSRSKNKLNNAKAAVEALKQLRA